MAPPTVAVMIGVAVAALVYVARAYQSYRTAAYNYNNPVGGPSTSQHNTDDDESPCNPCLRRNRRREPAQTVHVNESCPICLEQRNSEDLHTLHCCNRWVHSECYDHLLQSLRNELLMCPGCNYYM